MNKEMQNVKSAKKKPFADGRWKDLLIISVLALVLMIAAWKIFHTGNDKTESVSATQSETEKKVERLLADIDGVGEASVMICETEDGVTGVVVVCEGAKDIRVVMNIREAVAAALGTEQKAVKIYQKEQ